MSTRSDPTPRLATETSLAYTTFLAYRDLGPGRSLAKTAKLTAKHIQNLKVYSAKFDWPNRAKAWDDHLAAIRRAAYEKAATRRVVLWEGRLHDALEAAFEDAQRLRRSARDMLSGPVWEKERAEDGSIVVKPGRWTFATAQAMISAAAELEQKAITAATDDVPLEAMTDGALEGLQQVVVEHYGKAGASPGTDGTGLRIVGEDGQDDDEADDQAEGDD